MMCPRLVRWARLWRDRDHGQVLRHLEKLSRLSLREKRVGGGAGAASCGAQESGDTVDCWVLTLRL